MNKSPQYHPVIFLPEDYEIYDFSEGYDPNRELKSNFGIGISLDSLRPYEF